MHDSHDPMLDQLTSHHDVHPHESYPMYHGYGSYSPDYPEWHDREYHDAASAEYDYFAGMFAKQQTPPKPAAQSKPTSTPPMK